MSFAHHLLRPVALGLILAGGAGVLAGCGTSDEAGSGAGDRPVVAATAPQVDGIVRALAGDGVEVASVVAATADVHELELRPSQVRALKEADLILQPGRGNDAWAAEAVGQLSVRTVDLSDGLPGDERHWWMDPSLAERAAVRAAGELDTLDPAGKTARASRLERLLAELRTVDADTKRCLATVPAAARVIVTDHDAVGAYAARYGLTVAGTISPGAEPEAAPSAQRVVELVRTMKAKNVKAVFPIAPHGSELSSTVAERTGATLGAPLWADALPGATGDHAGNASDAVQGDGAADSGAHTGSAVEPTLVEAARLNGNAVAEALGAKASACKALLT